MFKNFFEECTIISKKGRLFKYNLRENLKPSCESLKNCFNQLDIGIVFPISIVEISKTIFQYYINFLVIDNTGKVYNFRTNGSLLVYHYDCSEDEYEIEVYYCLNKLQLSNLVIFKNGVKKCFIYNISNIYPLDITMDQFNLKFDTIDYSDTLSAIFSIFNFFNKNNFKYDDLKLIFNFLLHISKNFTIFSKDKKINMVVKDGIIQSFTLELINNKNTLMYSSSDSLEFSEFECLFKKLQNFLTEK